MSAVFHVTSACQGLSHGTMSNSYTDKDDWWEDLGSGYKLIDMEYAD